MTATRSSPETIVAARRSVGGDERVSSWRVCVRWFIMINHFIMRQIHAVLPIGSKTHVIDPDLISVLITHDRPFPNHASPALASSHSASISASVISPRVFPCASAACSMDSNRRGELCAGGRQGLFGADVQEARQVHEGEQEVAELFLKFGVSRCIAIRGISVAPLARDGVFEELLDFLAHLWPRRRRGGPSRSRPWRRVTGAGRLAGAPEGPWARPTAPRPCALRRPPTRPFCVSLPS